MAWDVFVILAAFCLAISGWTIGIINSWRGFIALLMATAITQHFYIDFSTWIVQKLLIPPDKAALLGYLMMWVALEIIIELLLNLIITWNRKKRPLLLERIGGAAFAVFKCTIAVTFALMAMLAPSAIPAPPENDSASPFQLGFESSEVIKVFSGIAKENLSGLGRFVVSTKAPSFKPDFTDSLPVKEDGH